MGDVVTPPGIPLAPRRVPEAYLRAEIASFPLGRVEAFRSSMVELDPTLEGKTRDLWSACEKELAQHAGGWSLDRLIMTRDFFWFGCGPNAPRNVATGPVSMTRYLRDLSRDFLDAYPGITVLSQRHDANAFDAYIHYRWLTFALPEDLLLAAAPTEVPPTQVNVEYPLLLQHLVDRGAPEVHHHVGAGMDFPLLWASLLAKLTDSTLSPRAANSPDLPFDLGERLLRWLVAAAVARCVLAEFLLQCSGTGAGLKDFLERLYRSPSWPQARARLLNETLQALSRGQVSELPEYYALQDLYGSLHPAASWLASKRPETVDEVWRRCDPIAVRLGLSNPNGGERWLIRHGLEWLERERARARNDPSYHYFNQLFWQVQRVRCIYYRTVVQRPLTSGLQWFVRFYDRLWWAREPLRAARAEVSYQVAGRGRPLSSLEVRITPHANSFSLAEDLHELTRSWTRVLEKSHGPRYGARAPEFGVILHFVKERDPEQRWATGAPPAAELGTHAEPRAQRGLRLGGRFASFFSDQSVRARSIAALLGAVPQALWLVRGLDVAADELSVPTWVLVPLYRYIHRQATLASMSPAADGAPPLRLTAHVGEDYRHLMEGLRRVFECIQYLLERFGGRLGHATALGVEPRLWAESAGSVMTPAEERMWDLVFEWRLYSGYRIAPHFLAEAPPGRPEHVENLIRELSSNIFGRCYEPQVMAEAHHILHRLLSRPESRIGSQEGGLESLTRALHTLDPRHVRYPMEVREIIRAYREDEQTFKRGQELVDITLDASEIAALYAAQNALRRGVGLRNIVVEVNPSSNLLTGDMLDLRNHPILRLFPPERQEKEPPPVPIAVGSDDPMTFSTWLLHEYSLLFEAALTAGYPERVVHSWLENIQKMGMDARFTVAWLPTARKRADALLRELERYLLLPDSRRPRRSPGRPLHPSN
ncbi:hypothetical protein [Myxococcus sp. RHSTA-1-4]|uniref:hypothetical protein n=1 Tax=Myxococcus sp. RHSTA-1-4 TaxID=2874601 RepID=UPI001CBBAC67|nr:hypothetical protein [Myxococcus sp. RHSTA-1-4]MBZ4420235.1 hypothetical protein [Myxococcus sp. RHSTA-1-4]